MSARTATYRERNRANGLCSAGPHPNPEYETFAYCRTCRMRNSVRSKRCHDAKVRELANFTATCAYSKCQRVFTPHRRRVSAPWTRCCSRTCARRRSGELATARGFAHVHQGRRDAAARALREEVTSLKTDAEIAAYRLGFQRGYSRGAYQRTKRSAA